MIKKTIKCDFCGKKIAGDEIFTVELDDEHILKTCRSCVVKVPAIVANALVEEFTND